MHHDGLGLRCPGSARWLLHTTLLLILSAAAWPPAQAMEALKSSRYFTDSAVATFVDHVQRGDVARVRQGLAAGISANALGKDGFRPIFFVFVSPKADLLRELLAAGADPNARLANGNTPLHFAVRMANPEFTALLLAAKADPNARGDIDQPVIHVATSYEDSNALELLVKGGADIETAWAGSTPLVEAVATKSWKSAIRLLRLGANPAATDRRGKTAADWWCGQLKRMPTALEYRAEILALADAFAARGVVLPCADEVARFR